MYYCIDMNINLRTVSKNSDVNQYHEYQHYFPPLNLFTYDNMNFFYKQTPEQEGILEGGGTVFLFDGLQIAHIIGELCADIWKVCRKSGCPTQ